MDQIGVRLRQERERMGLNQTAFAALAGQSLKSQTRYERGERAPDSAYFSALKQHGVDVAFIMTGERASPATDTSMLGIPMSDFVQVREYGAQLSAGPGTISGPVEVVGEFAFRSSWLRQLTSSPGECYLVRVKGDSMQPTIPDGAVVLIDQQQRDPRQRRKGIFALRIEDEVLVKRLELVDDTLLVESDNPDYSTRLVPRPKSPQVDILGKVIWQSSLVPDART